ncbi:MAG: hypothetical protein ACREUA_00830 [Burkholderiales bacterium]
MTFAELLEFLGAHTPLDILDGDTASTLQKAATATHRNALVGRVIADMFARSGLADLHAPITRAQAISALGPIRLMFMKDDAPVEGFRAVERIVQAIDGAFNDEALRLKSQGKQS